MFKVKHEIFIKSSLNKLLRNNPEPKHQHVQAYRKYCQHADSLVQESTCEKLVAYAPRK